MVKGIDRMPQRRSRRESEVNPLATNQTWEK